MLHLSFLHVAFGMIWLDAGWNDHRLGLVMHFGVRLDCKNSSNTDIKHPLAGIDCTTNENRFDALICMIAHNERDSGLCDKISGDKCWLTHGQGWRCGNGALVVLVHQRHNHHQDNHKPAKSDASTILS